MRIVGDRFVLQSEVFFDTSRADLKPEGRAELDKVAGAIVELESQIPPDIGWVLRVDGHTDVRPISGGQFKSNWDLSAARAIAVVQYLIDKGVQPDRLVAAAFGQYQPIDTGTTEDAYRRNRRIEFKLTERLISSLRSRLRHPQGSPAVRPIDGRASGGAIGIARVPQ